MRKASSPIYFDNFLLLFIPLIAGLLLSIPVKSQNFNYSFAKDSLTWQELNTQTILNTNNSAWNFAYRIPIGFSFNYLGRTCDSVTIETNGYLVFDEDRNYAFTAFLGFGDCIDAAGNHSVIGYSTSGTAGNRILKIQYKNTGSWMASSQFFTYQIWLKENSNTVEVHIGPNDFQPGILALETDTIIINPDSIHAYRVGLLNMNMNTETCGFFIAGTTAATFGQPVYEAYPDTPFLVRAPSQGTRYTFTPNSN